MVETIPMVELPLHDEGGARGAAWRGEVPLRCACGASHARFARRCPSCRARNPLSGLRGRRRRLERWLERELRAALPELRKLDPAPGSLAVFTRMLAEVTRRPVAERQRGEELGAYLRRLTAFFPSMFKTTSPELLTRELDDELRQASQAITRQALRRGGLILERVLGHAPPRPAEGAFEAQAERVHQDLQQALAPACARLSALQGFHDGAVQAWAPVRPLLLRPPGGGALRRAWDGLREVLNPVGHLFRFGRAIWRSAAERAALAKLEAQLLRYLREAERFRVSEREYVARRDALLAAYLRALGRSLAADLIEAVAAAPGQERTALVARILAQPGMAGLWRRLLGRRAPAAAQPGST